MAIDKTAIKQAVDTALPNGQTGVEPIKASTTRALFKLLIDTVAGWVEAEITPEAIQDIVGSFLQSSQLTGVTMTYDDANNRMVMAVPAAGMNQEQIQDMMATFLTQGSSVTLSYNDAGDTLQIAVATPGNATTTTAGLMSPTDKVKLDGLANAVWNPVTASATTVTGVVALGANPFNTCDITTTGNLVVNVTASGRSRLLLRVTIGTAGHTVQLQYGGENTSVRFEGGNPAGNLQVYPSETNTVLVFDCQSDGTVLDVIDWYATTSGPRQARTQTVSAATGAMAINMAGLDDYYGFWTLTGNVTSLALTNLKQGQMIYIRAAQGGAGSFSITFPTVTPNVTFPTGAAVSWNTAVGTVNEFVLVVVGLTVVDANSTKR